MSSSSSSSSSQEQSNTSSEESSSSSVSKSSSSSSSAVAPPTLPSPLPSPSSSTSTTTTTTTTAFSSSSWALPNGIEDDIEQALIKTAIGAVAGGLFGVIFLRSGNGRRAASVATGIGVSFGSTYERIKLRYNDVDDVDVDVTD